MKLYSELAAITMASFLSSRESPVRLNYGLEESKDGLRKFRGEDDDDFQFLEYQVLVTKHACMQFTALPFSCSTRMCFQSLAMRESGQTPSTRDVHYNLGIVKSKDIPLQVLVHLLT